MIPTRTPPPTSHRRQHDSRAAARRFWIDLVLACLAGVVLALTVVAISSHEAL